MNWKLEANCYNSPSYRQIASNTLYLPSSAKKNKASSSHGFIPHLNSHKCFSYQPAIRQTFHPTNLREKSYLHIKRTSSPCNQLAHNQKDAFGILNSRSEPCGCQSTHSWDSITVCSQPGHWDTWNKQFVTKPFQLPSARVSWGSLFCGRTRGCPSPHCNCFSEALTGFYSRKELREPLFLVSVHL